MSFPLDPPDYDTVKGQQVAFLGNRAPDLGVSPAQFGGELTGATTQLTQSLQESIAAGGADIAPNPLSSFEGLSAWADAIGLESGAGPGQYGPLVATPALGMQGALSGANGIVYPLGQQASGPGGVLVQLRAAVTLPGTFGTAGTSQTDSTGAAAPIWDAVEPGTAGNLPAGAVLTILSGPPGCDPTCTLAAGPATAGTDAESTAHLYERVSADFQRPKNGGNGADYVYWVRNALDSSGNRINAVLPDVWFYPNYYGALCPMAVVTLPVAAGDAGGALRIPSATTLQRLMTAINGTTSQQGLRPIGHNLQLLPPFMPNWRQLFMRARVVPSRPAYAYDWTRGTADATYQISFGSGTSTLTATGWTPGNTPAAGGNFQIDLSGVASGELKTKIAATATGGTPPRLFADFRNSLLPLGTVIPEQVQILGYQDVAGPVTRLLLKVASPTDWTSYCGVSVTTPVYSGGPVVAPAAQAVLDAVNALGPSNASGLADPATPWRFTLAVSSVSTAIENTLDTDQITRLVANCLAGSVVIGVGGTMVPVAADVSAQDNTTSGPELLRAGRILVTD